MTEPIITWASYGSEYPTVPAETLWGRLPNGKIVASIYAPSEGGSEWTAMVFLMDFRRRPHGNSRLESLDAAKTWAELYLSDIMDVFGLACDETNVGGGRNEIRRRLYRHEEIKVAEIDRHEAECARVEAEFNGTDPLDPRLPDGMLMMQFANETRRLFDEIAARIKAIEARLDAK